MRNPFDKLTKEEQKEVVDSEKKQQEHTEEARKVAAACFAHPLFSKYNTERLKAREAVVQELIHGDDLKQMRTINFNAWAHVVAHKLDLIKFLDVLEADVAAEIKRTRK